MRREEGPTLGYGFWILEGGVRILRRMAGGFFLRFGATFIGSKTQKSQHAIHRKIRPPPMIQNPQPSLGPSSIRMAKRLRAHDMTRL